MEGFMSGDMGLDETIIFYSEEMTQAKLIVLKYKGIKLEYKEVISSPVYFIPVLLLSIMIIIEGFHIFNHKQNCKTKAEWMEQSGMTYDRESEVN